VSGGSEPTQRLLVGDLVDHGDELAMVLEVVLVSPVLEGARLLFIYEAEWRFPLAYHRAPVHRDPHERQLVVDARPSNHADRQRRPNPEPQEPRRYRLEVTRVRKEVEDLRQGPHQPLLSSEDTSICHSVPSRESRIDVKAHGSRSETRK
jgi:hypothetical protein